MPGEEGGHGGMRVGVPDEVETQLVEKQHQQLQVWHHEQLLLLVHLYVVQHCAQIPRALTEHTEHAERPLVQVSQH